MGLRHLYFILVGGLSGAAAFIVFENTGFIAAAATFTTVAWILYRFSSGKLLWDTGKHLINPATAFMVFLGLGVTYLALDLEVTGDSLLGGLGVGILGAALGMLLFKYWTIGD